MFLVLNIETRFAGWLSHEAMQVIDAVKDLGVMIEQPCKTYDECIKVGTMQLYMDFSYKLCV